MPATIPSTSDRVRKIISDAAEAVRVKFPFSPPALVCTGTLFTHTCNNVKKTECGRRAVTQCSMCGKKLCAACDFAIHGRLQNQHVRTAIGHPIIPEEELVISGIKELDKKCWAAAVNKACEALEYHEYYFPALVLICSVEQIGDPARPPRIMLLRDLTLNIPHTRNETNAASLFAARLQELPRSMATDVYGGLWNMIIGEYEQCRLFVEERAHNGDVTCRMIMGLCLKHMKDVLPNDEGIELIKENAEKYHHVPSMLMLQKFKNMRTFGLELAAAQSSSCAFATLAMDASINHNKTAALELAHKADMMGPVPSTYYVMSLYEDDYNERRKLLLTAAKGHEPDAICKIGWAYFSGTLGVQTNMERALEWFLISANLGHSASEFNAASVYNSQRQYDLYFTFLARSAGHGNIQAIYYLGMKYLHSIVNSSVLIDQGKELIYAAASCKYIPAMRRAATLLMPENRTKAIQFLTDAANMNDVFSCRMLLSLAERGIASFPLDDLEKWRAISNKTDNRESTWPMFIPPP